MTAPKDPAELRAWLTNRVAEYLRLPAPEIDTSTQLAEYGLDSVYALALCGDIEDPARRDRDLGPPHHRRARWIPGPVLDAVSTHLKVRSYHPPRRCV
jgi:hypothetical protein